MSANSTGVSGAPESGNNLRWPDGVQRVLAMLQALGHTETPRMLSGAARTAQQAADALGVELGQIAKSIVFRRLNDDAAVLVITAGDRRVDEAKVAALVGALGRADAAFVKARSGYAIGGVPPLAHTTPPVTLIDRTLLRFESIWAAAGHPHAVFPLAPLDLLRWLGAPICDVVQTEQSSSATKNIAPSADTTGAVASLPISPCTGVCRIDETTGWCLGCRRTLEEIATWSSADAVQRQAVLDALPQRRFASSDTP